METEQGRKLYKADLHMHSRHSGMAKHLKFLRCRDCYSKPIDVYRTAKRRGMDLVTITDHDSIDGCLELLDQTGPLDDFVIAGSHVRRIQEFQQALADPNTKAVFAARGGYGSGYLTEKLTKGNLQPKVVLGASDLTIVHLHLLKHFGWVTFYGPMVAQEFSRGPEAYDEASLRASLEGKSNWVAYEGGTVLRQGTAEGILLGGCLSLIVATLGTPDEPDTRGALLLVEDINAKPYQVDRMLLQLERAGKLDEVRGIVFGQMPGCVQDSDQKFDQGYELTDVIADVLGDFKGPIARRSFRPRERRDADPAVGRPCAARGDPHLEAHGSGSGDGLAERGIRPELFKGELIPVN